MNQCIEQARQSGDYMACVSLFAEPCAQANPAFSANCHNQQMHYWAVEIRYWDYEVKYLAEAFDERIGLSEDEGMVAALGIVRDQWTEYGLAACILMDLAGRYEEVLAADLETCLEREHARYIESLFHISRAIR